MKFKVSKDKLVNATQTIQGVVSQKATLPILNNVLIKTQKNRLQLITTDLDIAITTTIEAQVTQEGETTTQAKRFYDIIRELPNQDITITTDKNNNLNIKCQTTNFKLSTLPREDFPKLPTYKNQEFITIEQETLKEMLNKTSFAISYDETRYILNGVLFEIKPERLNLVATDGRRLAHITKTLKTNHQKTIRAIVPTKTINELQKTLKEGQVKIYTGEKQFTFELGPTIIISRLIEGEFPQYEQVIPKEQKEKLHINRTQFLAATKRASILTNRDSQAIRLDVSKDKVTISKNTPEVGEAREEITAEYKGSDLTIGFNPTYLIDVLKNINVEKVGFELTGPDKPGVIRTEGDFVYVVLPMQII